MKRLIALLVAFALLFSVACADGLSDFIERWNKAAGVLGAPEISQDMLTDDGKKITAEADGWSMTLIIRYDVLIRAEVAAAGEEILPLASTLGTAVVTQKTAEMFTQFLGNLLYRYLKESKGNHIGEAAFGDYDYSLHMEDGIYTFQIVK